MSEDRLLVQIASYNTNLQAERGLPQDLVDWLAPTLQVSNFLARAPRAPDIVAVGFQELLPLHLGLSGLSRKVIEDRNVLILSQIEEHAPNKEKYVLIAKVANVGVALLVYGRDDTVGRKVEDVQMQWTGCGPCFMGNKGAVGVRFRVKGDDGGIGEVFTFVCSHLTAHSHKTRRRIDDYHHIVGTLLFGPLDPLASNESTTIYSTSHLFFFGDLNFRLDLPENHVLSRTSPEIGFGQLLEQDHVREDLKQYDQLLVERDQKHSAFVGLREGEFWRFKCSYKYILGEVDKYDMKRHPAWTDRIMYTTYSDSPDTPQRSNITNALYTSIPSYTTSDHKPIVAVLLLPPPAPSITPSGPRTIPPLLQLPSNYAPHSDPYATLKRYTGRTLDRMIGYIWWLVTVLGAGSTLLGIGNFVLGLGMWGWWRSKPPTLPSGGSS
ncbi:skeletal muscle/kidney enriched inositol 5-phosphatase [Irpex rosettiformis]|uniref:Skeletal muscle/kidney enriched inositol 5-phosphatase n=1 Tax=Irpex rosettiformis TaxID=378272 RepID=A0ACB8UHR6_9APHY|nr:skeletal muscle/kidney enriched inositol 5-phosphatase [Irpex rosettiformis]